MIIDRIENGIAVIEDNGCFFEISISELPDDAKEGSVLIKNIDGYKLDPTAEKERRRAAAQRRKMLFRRGKAENSD